MSLFLFNYSESWQVQLLVDQETIEFTKGMGAHATSTLVYDLSQYSNKYTRFKAFVGLDYSQGNNGNGIKVTISSSKDGKKWDILKETDTLKGNKSSVNVDVDITGVKYLKLYAHDNGANGNDHAVYADAKIMTKEYYNKLAKVQLISEIDSKLKQNSIENVVKNQGHDLYKRAFLERVGSNALEHLYNTDPKSKLGVESLLNNQKALAYYIESGVLTNGASYITSLQNWSKIYEKHKEDFNDPENGDFFLKLAVSVSMSHAKHVYMWTGRAKPHDPVMRYETYKALATDGTMDQGGDSDIFKGLSTAMMRWVTNARLHEDEVEWLADYALTRKAKGQNYLDAYNYILYKTGYNYGHGQYYSKENYNKWNEKYNISAFKDYGVQGIQRNFMVFEQGAVCGGLAKTYTTLAEVFGRPAEVVGQPGHAAAIVYEVKNGKGYWSIKNDISGWSQSGVEMGDMVLNWGKQAWNQYDSASYIVLTQNVLDDYDNYVKALKYNLLADVYAGNPVKQQEIYNKALEVQHKNLDSMVGLINAYKADSSKTSADYLALARRVIDAYNYYPLPMVEVLNLIKGNITDPNDIVTFDLLKTTALNKATVAKDSDVYQPEVCRQMANALIGKNKVDLASFSFDGKNANQIVINSKYDGSDIRVQYSLDGGKNWEQTEEHIMTLTKDQLNSIDPEKDIKVGLVGGQETFTIDIKGSAQITESKVYKNDWENTLLGDINSLEFSLDGGNTWCDYVKGTKFEGDQTVKLRYKPRGVYLQSNTVEYKFTAESTDETKKYIPLENVTLVSFSSQENNSTTAGKNFIDGNANTVWHTKYSIKDTDKSYVVKLDKIRYITALEYLSNKDANGRLKDADVYTSLDGKEWTKSGSVKNLPNNAKSQTIPLDAPTKAQYVKLVGVSTYGIASFQANMFMSGRMLNFYEDATLTVADPSVTDVTYGQASLSVTDVTYGQTSPSVTEATYDTGRATPELPETLEYSTQESNEGKDEDSQTSSSASETKETKETTEAKEDKQDTETSGDIEKKEDDVSVAVDEVDQLEEEENSNKPFLFKDVDVKEGNWKYESVKYVYENNIMNGISDTNQFEPDSSLTRGMFATVLYRIADTPSITYTNTFVDVAEGKWYSDAILWANQEGIVNGFSSELYGVDANITREQIAKMLYEYAKRSGYDVNSEATLDDFTDKDSVSGWATDYMKWATSSGMISGKPNGDGSYRLDPKGEATRAECAAMLTRFIKKYQ